MTQYIHDRGKHNKFWSYEIDDDHNVTVRWGRMGTQGQSKVHLFASSYDASRFIDKKIAEKMRKGYKKVESEEFNLKKFQAELLGAGSKINTLCFVEKMTSLDDRNIYKEVKEESALANPDYEPLIYASLRFTGRRGERGVLISTEKVYACEEWGLSWAGPEYRTFRLEGLEEIGQYAPKELLWLKEKAPGLVAALIR